MKTSFILGLGSLALSQLVYGSPAPFPAPSAPSAPTPGGGRFSIPPGSPDGGYIHTLNEDGSITTEYLGNSTHAIAARFNLDLTARVGEVSNAVDKRASQGVYCQNYNIGGASVSAAEAKLVDLCGTGGWHFTNVVSWQSGNAIAYGCNYGSGQTCYGSQIEPFFNSITSSCGYGDAGWWSQPSWKASYGVASTGTSYC